MLHYTATSIAKNTRISTKTNAINILLSSYSQPVLLTPFSSLSSCSASSSPRISSWSSSSSTFSPSSQRSYLASSSIFQRPFLIRSKSWEQQNIQRRYHHDCHQQQQKKKFPERVPISSRQTRKLLIYNRSGSFISYSSTTSTTESNAAADSANQLLAHICPMKRILCLCPVPAPVLGTLHGRRRMTSGDAHDLDPSSSRSVFHAVSMAVSDPYLSYAVPIQQIYRMDNASSELLYDNVSKDRNEQDGHTSWVEYSPLPKSWQELLESSGHSDIGAVIIGLPLLVPEKEEDDSVGRKDDSQVLSEIQHELHSHVQNLLKEEKPNKGHWQHSKSKGFPCLVLEVDNSNSSHNKNSLEDRITLEQAQNMAREEPEMWQEVSSLLDHAMGQNVMDNPVSPEVHATVALNVFLWKYTGGWRNTFA